MRFSIFTATYNRGYIIDNLFESLKRQSFTDFEWVVVDDGSTDNTEQKFNEFESQTISFPIHYIKVANGGKHRAVNVGVQAAVGDLFFIVDSDDYLTDDALDIIDKMEKTIPAEHKHKFAGVCGLKGFSLDNAVGNTFDGDILDITTLERDRFHISGDKAEVFYTEVLRKYPYPEFFGENHVTPCVVWDRIAHDGFKLRFFNKIVYICEYLPDGLTARYEQLFSDNPKGYGIYLHQSCEWGRYYGVQKWNQYLKYYYQYRRNLRFTEIARNLHQSPVAFWWRILGLKIFYKLYDR